MAIGKLKTDFQDDVLAEAMNGKRQYAFMQNDNDTYSIEDVTEYDRVGDDYGAAEIIETNKVVNGMMYVEVTVVAAGWEEDKDEGIYTYTVEMSEMTADWIPGNPVLVPSGDKDTDLAAQDAFACVSTIISLDGRLSFVCYEELPEADFTVRIPGIVEG